MRIFFGTVPDVTRIAFLFDRDDTIRFLGSSFGLPEDGRTALIAVLLVKLGLADPSIFADPNFVLDVAEQQTISQRILNLNAIIQSVATSHGMAVADVHAVFELFGAGPQPAGGIPLSTRHLGGLFSLDGVHPSNNAHAVVANLFITLAIAFNLRVVDAGARNMPDEYKRLEWDSTEMIDHITGVVEQWRPSFVPSLRPSSHRSITSRLRTIRSAQISQSVPRTQSRPICRR